MIIKYLALIFVVLNFDKVWTSNNYLTDKACVLNGDSSVAEIRSLDDPIRIDFFISWKDWPNTGELSLLFSSQKDPSDEGLRLTFSNMTLIADNSLENPLEPTLSYTFPIENFKVGWNQIFLKYFKSQQKIEISDGDKQWALIPGYLSPFIDTIETKGLFSIIGCHPGLHTRFYFVPPKTDVKIPFVMFKVVDRFDLFSDKFFSMDVTLSKRQRVCFNIDKAYSVPQICAGSSATSFEPNRKYNVYMYPVSFDKQDIWVSGNYTFTSFTAHNTGDEGFYLQTFLQQNTNVPLSKYIADINDLDTFYDIFHDNFTVNFPDV